MVAAGASLISGIGFAGSYSAVRELALHKGFGNFSYAFPIGVDLGIVVLLALDLVLTWLRIPFPLLRQTAWLLTVATIAFNAAASWGDPLAMGMHAVIPVLFVVVVEASRHAVGRIAAITADRHMESVRLMRWMLSPVPTFRLWRRMKLWELRSYDEVVRLEQNRLVYRAQLRFRYGRSWRRNAPIQALLPLKLAKYGVPLDVTVLDRLDGPIVQEAPAAGALPAAAAAAVVSEVPAVSPAVAGPLLTKLAAARWRDAPQTVGGEPAANAGGPTGQVREPQSARVQPARVQQDVWRGRTAAPRATVAAAEPAQVGAHQGAVANTGRPAGQGSPWFKPPRVPRPHPPHPQTGAPTTQSMPAQPVGHTEQPVRQDAQPTEDHFRPPVQAEAEPSVFDPRGSAQRQAAATAPAATGVAVEEEPPAAGPELTVDLCVEALIAYQDARGHDPDQEALALYLFTQYGVSGRDPGSPIGADQMRRMWPELEARYSSLGRE